jgi:hypothetical protein
VYRALSTRGIDLINDAGGVPFSAWCARLSVCVRLLGLPELDRPFDVFRSAVCEGNVPLVRFYLARVSTDQSQPESRPASLEPRPASPESRLEGLHLKALKALDPRSRSLPLGLEADKAIDSVVRVIGRLARVSQSAGSRGDTTAPWNKETADALCDTVKRVIQAFKPVDASDRDRDDFQFHCTPPFGNGPIATVGALLQLGADPHTVTDSVRDNTTVLHELLEASLSREARDTFAPTFRVMLHNVRQSAYFAPPPPAPRAKAK